MPAIVAAMMFAIFMQSAGDPKDTDRDYEGLRGPVHTVRTDYERTVQSGSDKEKVIRERHMNSVYDRNGRLLEELSFGLEGCALSRHVFRYEGPAKRTEKIYWGSGVVDTNAIPSQAFTPIEFSRSLTLDSVGKRSEIAEYDPLQKLHSRTRYKYDDKGRVKETTTEFGSSHEQCSLKYNHAGFVEEESCRRTGGFESAENSTYKYETDSAGNWIKRTGNSATSFNGKPSTRDLPVTYREIEYYAVEANSPADTRGVSIASRNGSGLKPCSGPFLIRKSGGVLQESATKRMAPTYPAAARAQGISGNVVVELTIDEMGKVVSTRTIAGPAELRSAAEEAAKVWEFAPTYLTKMPVKVVGTIIFKFNL